MFKVLIIACTILPYPRGEILNTKCFSVTDKWQSTIHGYPSKEHCLKRIDVITSSIRKNFDYYEPRTVHESSLSPCVHVILANLLKKDEKAYEMYMRTARLDLDNYNNDTEDGLHITSMAGSWLALIKGFAGMRVKGEMISFTPFLPKKWKGYAFQILHRNVDIKVEVDGVKVKVSNLSAIDKKLKIYNRSYLIKALENIEINTK